MRLTLLFNRHLLRYFKIHLQINTSFYIFYSSLFVVNNGNKLTLQVCCFNNYKLSSPVVLVICLRKANQYTVFTFYNILPSENLL